MELTGNFNTMVYSGKRRELCLSRACSNDQRIRAYSGRRVCALSDGGSSDGDRWSSVWRTQKASKVRQIVTWFCHLALWLALSVAIIALNYICCGGRIRLYIFLGFFSGFLITFYTINWVASKMADYILYRKSKD